MNPPPPPPGGGRRKRRSSYEPTADSKRVAQALSRMAPNRGLDDISRRINAILSVGKPNYERGSSSSSSSSSSAPFLFYPPSAEAKARVAFALESSTEDSQQLIQLPPPERRTPVLRDFLGDMERGISQPEEASPSYGPYESTPVLRDFLGDMERRDKLENTGLEISGVLLFGAPRLIPCTTRYNNYMPGILWSPFERYNIYMPPIFFPNPYMVGYPCPYNMMGPALFSGQAPPRSSSVYYN